MTKKATKIFALILTLAMVLSAVTVFPASAASSITDVPYAKAMANLSEEGSKDIYAFDTSSAENLFGEEITAINNGAWNVPDKFFERIDNDIAPLIGGTTQLNAVRTEYSTATDGVIPSGNFGAKITKHVTFGFPIMETNAYYLYTFNVFTPNGFNNKDALSCYVGTRASSTAVDKYYTGTRCYDIGGLENGKWTKVSVVIYTGSTKKFWMFGIGERASATDYFYLDDVSLQKLSDTDQSRLSLLHNSSNFAVYDIDKAQNMFGDQTRRGGSADTSGSGMLLADAGLEQVHLLSGASDSVGKSPNQFRVEYNNEGIPKKGNYGIKVNAHTNFTLPYDIMKTNTYYVLSFSVYTKSDFTNLDALNCYVGPRAYGGANKKYEGTSCYTLNGWENEKWTKVSIIIYTGNSKLWTFGLGDKADANNYFYMDELSFIELPAKYQTAAAFLDTNYDATTYNEALENAVNVFTDVGAQLVSPVTGRKYSALESLVSDLKRAEDPNTIFGKKLKVNGTYNIEGYNAQNPDNLFLEKTNRSPDAFLEDSATISDDSVAGNGFAQVKDKLTSFSDAGISPCSGNYCMKIDAKSSITTPTMKKNTYYILSFMIYAPVSVANSTNTAWNVKFNDRAWTDGTYAQYHNVHNDYANVKVGEWSQVSYVIYSGYKTLIYMTFGEGGDLSENYFYIDDLALIPLDESVQNDAIAFDDYKGDYSDVNDLPSFDADTFSGVSALSDLCSPITGKRYYDSALKAAKINESIIFVARGDIDEDGDVDAYDLVSIRQMLLLEQSERIADANFDGKINLIDLVRAKKYIAGL